MSSSGPHLNESLKGVSWLLGKWKSENGQGSYPTLKDFKYGEEIEFTHVGQPNLQFSCYSWHLETKKPLHRELGFVRVQPSTNKVALIIAQNLGVCELEEGEVNGQEMTTTSHTLGRLSFGKDPATKVIKRTFRREGDTLQQLVEMETDKTPMTEHLRITYQKIDQKPLKS
ncbi:peroxynitrite isomerase THAP4-like [Mercenaria mercenaria]|uniref:peroxynitrite isomerase THAP4-like n=1 Tax=Mercenaria mercenaria TaxID=6596 RepID=UPI00234F7027|nr:peroxynitrite isomerase THAP4-like [Mercenaria mercenaria]